MTAGPLDRIDSLLPETVRSVVDRRTPIPSIAERAAALRRESPDLIRADIGQIVGIDAVEEVLYGPPAGLPALRSALAETWNRCFGFDRGVEGLPEGLREDNVAVCTGAAEGLSLLFRCFASGRRVGLPRGHWENYANGIDLAGGATTVIDHFDGAGRLDVEGIARRVRDEDIDVLVTNFPANPTGAVLEAEEYARLGAMLRDLDVVAIADEVYNRLRFDGLPGDSLVRHAPSHAVAVSSASKEYLLPGGRIGYVVSARSELTSRVLPKLVRANTASPNVLGQIKLLAYLERDLEDLRAGREAGFIARVRHEMKSRRDRLVEILEARGMPPVGRAGHRPEGTIFLMASLPEWWAGDETSFAETALERRLFSCIPGSAFGVERAVRFSYGATTLADLDRLGAALDRMRG